MNTGNAIKYDSEYACLFFRSEACTLENSIAQKHLARTFILKNARHQV